jgi:hypothetical protein
MSQRRRGPPGRFVSSPLEEIINLICGEVLFRHEAPLDRSSLAAEIDRGFLAGRFGLSRRTWAAAVADY